LREIKKKRTNKWEGGDREARKENFCGGNKTSKCPIKNGRDEKLKGSPTQQKGGKKHDGAPAHRIAGHKGNKENWDKRPEQPKGAG